jgi:hypothetical protein
VRPRDAGKLKFPAIPRSFFIISPIVSAMSFRPLRHMFHKPAGGLFENLTPNNIPFHSARSRNGGSDQVIREKDRQIADQRS